MGDLSSSWGDELSDTDGMPVVLISGLVVLACNGNGKASSSSDSDKDGNCSGKGNGKETSSDSNTGSSGDSDKENCSRSGNGLRMIKHKSRLCRNDYTFDVKSLL
jgi:hypothetical protein